MGVVVGCGGDLGRGRKLSNGTEQSSDASSWQADATLRGGRGIQVGR